MFGNKYLDAQLTKNKSDTEAAVKPRQLDARLRIFLIDSALGVSPNFSCTLKQRALA